MLRYILIFSSAVLFFIGINSDDDSMLVYAQIVFSGGLLLSHYIENRFLNIDPIIVFNASACLIGIAHVYAISADSQKEIDDMLDFASFPHISAALQIYYIGVAMISFGFLLSKEFKHLALLKKIEYELPPNFNYNNIFYVSLIISILTFFNIIDVKGSGAIGKLFNMIPLMGMFFLVRKGAATNNDSYIRNGFWLTIITTLQAVLTSYLRSRMIFPCLLYFLALFIGQRSIKNSFFHVRNIPLVIGIFLFFFYFQFLGEARTNVSSGFSRVNNLIDFYEANELLQRENIILGEQVKEGRSFMGRISMVNQLSQVERITDTDGYLNGATLGYFVYAFIPRFIWPDKPEIAQGKWFALKIGRGFLNEGGINNSINMTIPGELYMNFGFIGLAIGGVLFGFIIGEFWKTTNFWGNMDNILGIVFALYMFSISFEQLGADLQILVTITAMYLSFIVIMWLLKIIHN